MTPWTLIRRSLRHFAVSEAVVAFGVAVGVAAIVGSLVVGDSFRHSLRREALSRLGEVDYALTAGRYVSADLAKRLAQQPGFRQAFSGASPAILLDGVAQRGDGEGPGAQASVIGVNGEGWRLIGGSGEAPKGVCVSAALAEHLGAQAGEDILIRLPRTGDAAVDSLFGRAARRDSLRTLRLTVARVLGAEAMPPFSPTGDTSAAGAVVVPLGLLQRRLEREGQANSVLVAGLGDPEALREALAASARLGDYGLRVREIAEGIGLSVESRAVTLRPDVVRAVRGAAKATDGYVRPTSVYLANEMTGPADVRALPTRSPWGPAVPCPAYAVCWARTRPRPRMRSS